jgi:hypothetical protein
LSRVDAREFIVDGTGIAELALVEDFEEGVSRRGFEQDEHRGDRREAVAIVYLESSPELDGGDLPRPLFLRKMCG